MKPLGIYFHVPFCGKKCSYCDFYSVNFKPDTVEKYVNAVIRNLRHYSDLSLNTDTIYFGGGTPSLLTSHQIDRILSETTRSFNLAKNAEITLEANPNTITSEKLRQLRRIGINRLSIGVQTLDNNELKFLGRTHTPERAVQAVNDTYDAGFENISCDLMIAIPGQTSASLEKSISRLTELPIRHISAYILKIEDGTPMSLNGIEKLLPNEDETAALYLKMVNQLEAKGFEQYEISNFAKKGYESRHNCRYWRCEDYLGIGPAAHSCYMNKRFAVEADLQKFIESPVQQVYVTDNSPCDFEETSMLRLRLKEGLDLMQTGSHRNEIEKKIPALTNAGYALFDGRFLSLTAKGFLMSNSIIEYLIF